MLHLSAHGRQEKLEERLSALMQSIDSATSEARRSSANIEHLQVSPPHTAATAVAATPDAGPGTGSANAMR